MNFHYTITTNKTIDEVLTTLEQNLKENKFGILWKLDLPAKLQEKGVNSYTTPYYILEVCNPVEAAHVLGHNQLVGYFLPCKIVVYESNGNVKIGLPKPTAMIGLLDEPKLISIAEDIEKILIAVLEKSK
jgi:uncharacterized protein (DUF302 family)